MFSKLLKYSLFAILVSVYCPSAFALEFLDDQRNINYTKLNYEASKLFMSFDTGVSLGKKPVSEVVNDLVMPKDSNALVPESGSIYTVSTESSFFGKHTIYTMWFDDNAALLQRLKELRRGEKSNSKLYRFARNGKHDFRKDYDSEDFKVNLGEVKNWGNSFAAYPVEVEDGQAVSESSALLYLVSLLKLQNPGDEQELMLYSRGQLVNTKLTVAEKTRLKVDFNIVSGGNSQRVKERDRSVIKVVVKPVDSQGNPVKDLKVMGLQGDISMYIDEATRLLLQISGEVKVAGEVDVKLKSAVKAQ
ncbi:hypothetical protein [Kaarinaea lacus]